LFNNRPGQVHRDAGIHPVRALRCDWALRNLEVARRGRRCCSSEPQRRAEPQHAAGDDWIYWWWDGMLWRMPDSGGVVEKIGGTVDVSLWAPWRMAWWRSPGLRV
jgi:hypothetical protein